MSAIMLDVGAMSAVRPAGVQRRIYDFTLEAQVHSAAHGGAAESTDALVLTGAETIVVRSRNADGSADALLDVVAGGTRNGVQTHERRSFAVRIASDGQIKPLQPLSGVVLPIVNLQNEAARELTMRQLRVGTAWSEHASDAGMPVVRSYRVSGIGTFAARRVAEVETAGAGSVIEPATGVTLRSLTIGATFYFDSARRELVGASGRSFSVTSGGSETGPHVNISVAESLRLRAPAPPPAAAPKPSASPTPNPTASAAASAAPAAPSTLPPGLGSTPAPAPSTLRSTAAPSVGPTPAPIGPVSTPPPNRAPSV